MSHVLSFVGVRKAMSMIIDFKKSSYSSSPTIITASDIEIVESYKYLGLFLTSNCVLSLMMMTLPKKAQQRLLFLKIIRSFNVSSKMFSLIYRFTEVL